MLTRPKHMRPSSNTNPYQQRTQSRIHTAVHSSKDHYPTQENMASSGVLPWLVGLPANDTAWEAAPAHDTAAATAAAASPQSEPGTLRSRNTANMDGTVNRRAQSSSPAKQQSLAWKKRLVDGQLGYGDQTDLFGPSGLENIFTRTQVADSCSQKKHRHMGLKPRNPMEQISPNARPATAQPKQTPMYTFPSSPPVAQSAYDPRTGEDSRDNSPKSPASDSSVVDMLSEMMGKMTELSESNKGYQTRMQAIKERLTSSEELRQKLERSERERQQAKGSLLYQKGQFDKGSAELLKSQRKLFDFAKQTISAERRADWAKSERRQLAEDYNLSKRKLVWMREEVDDWKEKYEEAHAELESLRSASPQSAASEESAKSEIITKPAESASHEINGDEPTSPTNYGTVEVKKGEYDADATRNTDSKRHTIYHSALLAPEATDASGNRSITDSDLEDLTPVLIAKRTTSNGKVSFNAIRSENAARNEIIRQRKDIDKTETSQRAREIELAIGTGQSDTDDAEQSTPNRTRVLNRIMGITDPSIDGGEDDSEVMGARHVSGFTDAPEVEEDMPITKQAASSGAWDFSEPPQNESSELAAAHQRAQGAEKRTVSFGIDELNDYAFKMVDQALADATEITVDETDGAQFSGLPVSTELAPPSREGSPGLDVQAPGCRMPLEFRKDSLSEIQLNSFKSKRSFGKDSDSGSAKPSKLSISKAVSPPQHIKAPDSSKLSLPKMRSPPQVYVEDADETLGDISFGEGKRPLPRSPLKSPTPKRRRTLHDSELQKSVTEANLSYHSQLQEAISTRKIKDVQNSERQNIAKPSVLAQRKIARPRNTTPSQGPATKDYINEAKKVIELLRGNNTSSSPLGGITEADEEENTQAEVEDERYERDYPLYNTHRSDNMRTLAPQQVAHLIGGEMHGMTFDTAKHCWIRSKSFEHKQFLDPRDALSSDDDPFREISDLTVEKSVRVQPRQPSQDAGADTVVHHELDDTGLSFGDEGAESERKDTPQQAEISVPDTPKLPGEDTTLEHNEEAHDGAPTEEGNTTGTSASAQLPSHITFPSPPNRNMPVDMARLQLATTTPNANINNTFLLSDLPDFTVHEEDHERPSERALATRLASYAAVEVRDPYTLATTELVKAITDVQGQQIHWEDLTSLCLHDKSLKSLHSLDEHCARVEKLDVSANALTQLEGVPPFVRQLNAQSNQLVSLTSWAHLMHLQYLDVSNNNLESVDGLGHLIHLRELRVDGNKVRSLNGIADLDGLITLSARNNTIREVNLEHFRFGRVVDLDLRENEITSIAGLEELPSLRSLKLDKNPIGQSLAVSKTMPRLKHLSLRSCGLQELDVSAFPNLRTLEVDNNFLAHVDGLSALKKLELLSMCAQDIEDNESITVFDSPLDAQTVRLSRNTIPELHLDHAFMSIKHLELSDCGLAALPANFGIQMPNLRSLDLSFNHLRDIRPLAPLSGLETLALVGCRIERLRKTMATLGKLGKLSRVDMKQNPLTQGFYGPEGSEDKVYRAKLDEETAIRRRTYELLVAYSCRREGFMLDGLKFDAEAAVAKDRVWERLVELGVLRKAD